MSTSTPDRKLFEQAVRLFKKGDRETARKYMRQVLLEDPLYVPAWLWMSGLVDDVEKQRECLERALVLDPNCEPASRGLKILRLRETVDALNQQHAQHAAQPHAAPLDSPESVAPPRAVVAVSPDMQQHGETEAGAQRQARKLGDYLVERGFITLKQLEEALEEQRLFWKKTQGVRAPLGNILIKHGLLTPQMLATALVTQQQDKLHGRDKYSPQYIGEYLVSRGIITPQQLENVLVEQMRLRQRGTTMLLGELLIYAGYISREVLDDILEQQRNELFSRFGFED